MFFHWIPGSWEFDVFNVISDSDMLQELLLSFPAWPGHKFKTHSISIIWLRVFIVWWKTAASRSEMVSCWWHRSTKLQGKMQTICQRWPPRTLLPPSLRPSTRATMTSMKKKIESPKKWMRKWHQGFLLYLNFVYVKWYVYNVTWKADHDLKCINGWKTIVINRT